MIRALIVVAVLGSAARADVLVVGQPAPELDGAVDGRGKPFTLAALRGRWVVLAVGAAWCVPCQAELPVWNKLAGKLAGRVTFVALAFDNDPADGKAFHQRLGISNLSRAYLPEDSSRVAERYGAGAMPVTFVIAPDGVIRHVRARFDAQHAQRESDELEAALAALLPKPAPPKPAPRPAPKPPAPPPPRFPAIWLPEPPRMTWWSAQWTIIF